MPELYEGARLLSECAPKAYRGFASHSLRHDLHEPRFDLGSLRGGVCHGLFFDAFHDFARHRTPIEVSYRGLRLSGSAHLEFEAAHGLRLTFARFSRLMVT